MKNIIILILFMTLSCNAQNPTPFARLKITANLKDNTATRILVQDSITKEVKWILKSSIGGATTPTLQQVTNAGATTTNDITVSPLDGSSAVIAYANGSVQTYNVTNNNGVNVRSDLANPSIEFKKTYPNMVTLKKSADVVSNISVELPIASGRLALTTDIPAPVDISVKENIANKQNSLAVDGTGVKYVTVDAVNADVVKLTGNQTISGLKDFTNRVKVIRTLADLNYHAFDDLSVLNISTDQGIAGYSSYDSYVTVNPTFNMNHANGYQSRLNFTGSSNIVNTTGYSFNFTHNGTGTVNNLYGVSINEPSGTGISNITNKYGLIIGNYTGGYAIYSVGGDNFFGGKLKHAVGTVDSDSALISDITTGTRGGYFSSLKLSNITSKKIPYKVSDATGLINSPLSSDGTRIFLGARTTNFKSYDLELINSSSQLFLSDNDTDITNKAIRIGLGTYTNANNPLCFLYGTSGSSANILNIGGGTGIMTAPTLINFFTAPTVGTNTGTNRMAITGAGNVLMNTTTDDGVNKLQVNGSTKTTDLKLVDPTMLGDASLSVDDEVFKFKNHLAIPKFDISINNISHYNQNGFASSIVDGTLTANRTYALPDASGTLALTTDIPAAATLQSVTTAGNITTNFVTVTGMGTENVIADDGIYLSGVYGNSNASFTNTGVDFSTSGGLYTSRYGLQDIENNSTQMTVNTSAIGGRGLSGFADYTANITDLDYTQKKYVDTKTALGTVTEGLNTGFRLNTVSPLNFGDIGADAVDFSYSNGVSATIGATGSSSFNTGIDNTSSGYNASTFGYLNTNNSSSGFTSGTNNQTDGYNNMVLGVGNNVTGTNITVVGQASNIIAESTASNNIATSPVFVVGNGTITDANPDYPVATRSDALIVRKNGQVTIPKYGTGTVTGTATYALAVDSSGKVIETVLGGGGGATDLAWSTGNTITSSTGTDVVIPLADNLNDGLLSISNQQVLGVKTFTNTPIFDTKAISIGGGPLSAEQRILEVNALSTGTGTITLPIDSGTLALETPIVTNYVEQTSDPATPSAGTLKLFAKKIGGKSVLKTKDSDGIDFSLQNSFWDNNITMWNCTSATTGYWTGTVGAGAGTFTNTLPTQTSVYTSIKRAVYSNVITTANQVLGQRNSELIFTRGNIAKVGGFFFFARFGFDTWTNGGRLFVGMHPNTTAVSLDPSQVINDLGFMIDAADNGLISFMSKDITATTKVSTGYTTSTGKGYDVYMYCAPNSNIVYWKIEDLNAGTEASGSVTTNLPTSTTMLSAGVLASNAALTTANAVRLGVNKIYIETDF